MKFTATISVLLVLLTAPAASAGDWFDTRVTFTIADDDVMRGPDNSASSTATGSPTYPNSQPSAQNRLFYDDYERRDTGFENLSHFVVYTHQPGFWEGLDTEAALVLRAEVLNEKGVGLTDDGTYINIIQDVGSKNKLMITAFPVSADRFRLGYSYKISWGGSGIFKTSRAAPGLKLQLEGETFYAFLGGKTGLGQVVMPDNSTEQDTLFGFLGGGGIDILKALRLEAGAAYFHRGTIDKQELRLSEGKHVKTPWWDAFGGCARVAYNIGMPVGVPIDFALYRNDPAMQAAFFKPEEYGDGISFLMESEINVLGQTLQDMERRKSTTIQMAIAGDVTGRLKIGKTRVFLLAVYRDLAFILFNVPSLSFDDFPDGVPVQPEFFVAAGVDYFFERAHLTPGIVLGLQRPANITTAVSAGSNPPVALGWQTLVYRSETGIDILDPGDRVELIYAAKLTAKLDLSAAIAAVGELQLSWDPNRRKPLQDPGGITIWRKQSPEIIGFNLMLQARF